MKVFRYTIKDNLGIHTRPAGMIVKTASDFNSDIHIKTGDKDGNAKSIISVMKMAVRQGDEVEVTAQGDDEEVAIKKIEELFFGNL